MNKTELIEAIKSGEAERVDALLSAEPSLAYERDENGVSLILLATYHGKREIAMRIGESRHDLDVFEACGLGRVDRVAEILADDPDVIHSFSPDGFPLVGFAAFFGNAELVRMLVDRGADVDIEARNSMKVHPLHSAVAFHDQETAVEMARTLLDAGADPNAVQQVGYTALQSAALHGNRPLVDLLIERGADPTKKSEDGKSPADMAREGGNEDLAEELERLPPRATL